ncbi:MAG: bifunctional riboflavin kinase/FAD synthetase [Microthrixaceae bacterium]
MQIVRDPGACPRPEQGTIVTIGAYDGLHLGHRRVIADVCARARAGDHLSAVVTFDRHPAQVIRPESAPRLLTGLDQKLELLESTGVDIVVVIHFDEVRAAEPPEDFVRTVLVDCLNAKGIVVGEDFHFGHRRAGNVALLAEMGADLGFEVSGMRLVGPDGEPARDDAQVSSTAIRRALIEGRLDDANRMLGRHHEMRGPVTEGDRRGRELGFPTANVAISDDMLMPADGIYAGHLRLLDGGPADTADLPSSLPSGRPARRRGPDLPSAIYVGHRPTFYDDQAATLLEVHVLDFTGDLYGAEVAVTFEHRLRGDIAFDDVESLRAQLAADCEQAAGLL